MIDDSRIQEVASAEANKQYAQWNGPCKEAYVKGFSASVNRLLAALWHDPNEEPQKDEQCLVDMEFLYEDAPEDNYRTFITSTYGAWGWTEDCMPSEATNFKLHRWCYIKDLLKGDNHE